jgi:hypothetical protein
MLVLLVIQEANQMPEAMLELQSLSFSRLRSRELRIQVMCACAYLGTPVADCRKPFLAKCNMSCKYHNSALATREAPVSQLQR